MGFMRHHGVGDGGSEDNSHEHGVSEAWVNERVDSAARKGVSADRFKAVSQRLHSKLSSHRQKWGSMPSHLRNRVDAGPDKREGNLEAAHKAVNNMAGALGRQKKGKRR